REDAISEAESNLPADAILDGDRRLAACERLIYSSALLSRTLSDLGKVMVQLSSTGGGPYRPGAVSEILFLPAREAGPGC
ncbi:MAG TPA: hypothetical protein VII45_06880, partial [Solirubrobacterales bacterium]